MQNQKEQSRVKTRQREEEIFRRSQELIDQARNMDPGLDSNWEYLMNCADQIANEYRGTDCECLANNVAYGVCKHIEELLSPETIKRKAC